MTENEIGTIVVDYSVKIHKNLGPGLLEHVYEAILAKKLQQHGLNVKRQVCIPIVYEDLKFDEGFRADIIIEDKVLLEIKSVEKTNKVHKKQVLTYLRLTEIKLGYLLNFGEELMKDGISRILDGTLE